VNVGLWVLQVLLALFFGLASSFPKLFLPADMLPPLPIPLPSALIMFIGVAEMAGAFGLILPGVLKMYTWLTPLAAVGLMLVALGGMGYQFASGEGSGAIFAIVFAGLCAFVAYGRWKLAPHRTRTEPTPIRVAA
jgi:putative oxidoreductase